jgi:hypothetical protein
MPLHPAVAQSKPLTGHVNQATPFCKNLSQILNAFQVNRKFAASTESPCLSLVLRYRVVVLSGVPPIYAPVGGGGRLSAVQRVIAFLITTAAAGLLLTAYWLNPDPSGTGTHLGLGLPRCAFMYYSGLPCPSCGMTTSFSYFAHGNLLASFWVQPMGTLLALLAAMTVWAAGYCACTGRDVSRLVRRWPLQQITIALVALAIAAWGWKIVIHLRGIDGWR